ncbi:hypothetical protein KDA82_38240, partial [Streptomyces daliensis]|nr:hypothetical protein [Streptomyces daliensis]
VIARIRRTLHADIALRELFTSPTVGELAVAVGRARSTHEVPLAPGQYEGPAPVSWAQLRMWFLDQLEPDNSLYNVPAAW